jgi:hypothetical protein
VIESELLKKLNEFHLASNRNHVTEEKISGSPSSAETEKAILLGRNRV